MKTLINTPIGVPESLHGYHQMCAIATWHNKGRPLAKVWSHKNDGVVYRYKRGKTLTIYIEAV